MLERLHIQNYRCLKDVDVPLRPLTVLIGPNDSGKSAFLRAVERLSAVGRTFETDEHWRLETDNLVIISGVSHEGAFAIDESQIDNRKDRDKMIGECALALQAITPIQRFELASSGVPMQTKGFAEGAAELPLKNNGEQVGALIDHFLRRDRKRFMAFTRSLETLIPGLEDVIIETPKPDIRRVDLVIDGGLKLPANLASSGVRLLVFFVALAYHPTPPRTILIEEPENGIHPKRLVEVVRLLREITEGKHGDHAAQVILTTHSPYLLDCIDVERDQVLVFQRNDDGSRSAQPADAARLKNFLDEFMLGEVWFNESEAGLVSRPT